MADSQLPERPSIEQLRKRAKDLLRAWRAEDPSAIQRVRAQKPHAVMPALADAQFVVAREHGFDSWPSLLKHIERFLPHSLEQNARLAADLVAVYRTGDAEAVGRLNDLFRSEYDAGQVRDWIVRRLSTFPDAERRLADFTVADAQLLVARLYGFDSWESLAESSTRPRNGKSAATHGLSAAPPFYRFDRTSNTIEPRQPMSSRDWDRLLDIIEETGVTGLNANGQIDDDVMEGVAGLSNVTRLNLGGSKRLTDRGLLHVARMPQLEELDLSDYPGGRITDRGLQVLRHLTGLRRFQICWQSGITDAGLEHLRLCDKLENVDLLGSPTGDGAIEALRGKHHLRHFKTGRLVTDAGLPLLHELPNFKTWRGGHASYDLMSFGDTEPNFLMLDGPFSNEGLAGLAGLEGLFGLGFFRHVSGLTADGLRHLAELPHLGALGCDGDLCGDTAMRHIAALPRLRMLMAQGTVASDDGFVALSGSRSIEYIWGRECPNLGGRGFAALAGLPTLAGLAVSCKQVDDRSLAALPSFPALRWLLPIDVPDHGFRHVGRCTQIERLTCMYCRDTGDTATEHISGLSSLKHYYAGQTRITDRSLEILGSMSSLEEVQLSGCQGVSDAGLVHLSKLPRLRQVSVDATARVSRAGVAVFPPHVRVDFWT